MTVEQDIALFAADIYLEDGQFLPVWLRPDKRVGGGDFPTASNSKSAAKRIATNQCNRESSGWRGYVVERRGSKLIVFLVTELDSATGKHVGLKDCWSHGWHFDLAGSQISVTIRADAPRFRPSSLAERVLAPTS
jgi:hypothetical protein